MSQIIGAHRAAPLAQPQAAQHAANAAPAQAPAHPPVTGPAGTPFAGQQVGAGPGATPGKPFSLSSFVKESAVVQKAAAGIERLAARTGHNGLATVAGSLRSGALEQARLDQSNLRADLSAPDPAKPSVLDKTVDVENRPGVKIADLMDELRTTQLGGNKRISYPDMARYIAMGERICDAVKNSPDGRPPLQTTVAGKVVTIPSNTDTARAVAWFMQAKSMVDNADPNRPVTTAGKSGATFVSDPGGKLYNFLSAAPTAYGRTSTHMKAQSENAGVKMSFGAAAKETGVISAFSVKGGGAIQRGIEDYSTKMPGGGGTMLFDKLKPDTNGNPILYMKLEPVGTPTGFSVFGRHTDPADGFAQHLKALGSVAGRNIDHGANLAGSIKAKLFSSESSYRGEKVDKGPTKTAYKDFMKGLEALQGVSDADKKTIKDTIKTNGATGLVEATRALELLNASGTQAPLNLAPLQTARDTIVALADRMGADLGMDRRGNEVHATY